MTDLLDLAGFRHHNLEGEEGQEGVKKCTFKAGGV
jgi:hypothetical protein